MNDARLSWNSVWKTNKRTTRSIPLTAVINAEETCCVQRLRRGEVEHRNRPFPRPSPTWQAASTFSELCIWRSICTPISVHYLIPRSRAAAAARSSHWRSCPRHYELCLKKSSQNNLPGPQSHFIIFALNPLGAETCPKFSYLLGLLAKIKCSICSYQLNL